MSQLRASLLAITLLLATKGYSNAELWHQRISTFLLAGSPSTERPIMVEKHRL